MFLLLSSGPIAPILITGPVAIAALLVLWWYYLRLNQPDIPSSRRKLRQSSIAVMVAGIPALLIGLSFTDYRRQTEQFAIAWIGVILLLMVLLAFVMADALNTARLHRQARRRIQQAALADLEASRTNAGSSADTDPDTASVRVADDVPRPDAGEP
jgi:undecaprenyl pyrophosphate phosphatase UppP